MATIRLGAHIITIMLKPYCKGPYSSGGAACLGYPWVLTAKIALHCHCFLAIEVNSLIRVGGFLAFSSKT